MVHQNYIISSTEFLVAPTRFSKWNRMLRATAYILRLIFNCKTKNYKKKTSLTQEVLRMAQSYLFRQAQNETYSMEISCLKSGKFIPKKSKITNLHTAPFSYKGVDFFWAIHSDSESPQRKKIWCPFHMFKNKSCTY